MRKFAVLREKKPSKERMYELIRCPVITEKATLITEYNQVTFNIPIDATKFEVKAAIEHLFSVKVMAINTSTQKGKLKRFKGHIGKRITVKKAIVTLKDGETIDVSASI
jgi:large subunit ribosomal protein L23